MNLYQHEKFILYALDGLSFDSLAKTRILAGNITQDTLYFCDSKRHFCRSIKTSGPNALATHLLYFGNANRYLQSERASVMMLIRMGVNSYARNSLGQALHTLQDLFAHSNYIDLTTLEQNQILTALKLKSSRIAPPLPRPQLKLTYWRLGSSGKNDEYTHEAFNKDGAGRPGWELAKAAAKECSKEFVGALKTDVITNIGMTRWKRFRQVI